MAHSSELDISKYTCEALYQENRLRLEELDSERGRVIKRLLFLNRLLRATTIEQFMKISFDFNILIDTKGQPCSHKEEEHCTCV